MEQNSGKMNINWYPGHMAKTKKQIMDDLKLIDVVSDLKTFDRLIEKCIKRKESE